MNVTLWKEHQNGALFLIISEFKITPFIGLEIQVGTEFHIISRIRSNIDGSELFCIVSPELQMGSHRNQELVRLGWKEFIL